MLRITLLSATHTHTIFYRHAKSNSSSNWSSAVQLFNLPPISFELGLAQRKFEYGPQSARMVCKPLSAQKFRGSERQQNSSPCSAAPHSQQMRIPFIEPFCLDQTPTLIPTKQIASMTVAWTEIIAGLIRVLTGNP